MKGTFGVTCLIAGLLGVFGTSAQARADDPVKFDLAGPKVDVQVQRGNMTLPIAQVPNLLAGDKLIIKADLPSTQSNHLRVAPFMGHGLSGECERKNSWG